MRRRRALKRGLLGLALLALTCTGRADSRIYVRRVAMSFEPHSTALPQGSQRALKEVLDDRLQDCQPGGYVSLAVEDVVRLPLGKTSAGATARTHAVAAAVQELSNGSLQPFESSLSADSDRARRLGLRVDQVLVELTCPPRTP